MKQILIIHGGSSYSSYNSYIYDLKNSEVEYSRLLSSQSWRNWIASKLREYDVLTPTMPNSANAKFSEWSIYFEKILKLLESDFQLVGHSLGAMFLVKYLHSKPLKNKAQRIVLIAPGYNDESKEEMGSFKIKSAKNIIISSDKIHLFYSKNDPIVPYSELAKFQADIPDATIHSFENKYHFWDDTFPELLNLLKS